MKGNYIFTSPGQKAFLVSSNYVNYIELGKEGITGYYLEAKIDNNEFVINRRLYDSDGNYLCSIRRNHLEDMQRGCEMCLAKDGSGYSVITEDEKLILGHFLKDENTCILKGIFYDDEGKILAKGDDQNFLIFHGPAVLGKMNGSRGIVLE
ncbi:hypothetical protein MUO98_08440 [Candidatus Bathyarchaeota archaeon]|nr:hypothetical protein [Candidatus Bathyarchaeota archaeon]